MFGEMGIFFDFEWLEMIVIVEIDGVLCWVCIDSVLLNKRLLLRDLKFCEDVSFEVVICVIEKNGLDV